MEILGKVVSFGFGFVTGALYASYKYDHNPNELVKMAGDDAKSAGKAVSEKATKAKDAASEKIKDIKKNVGKKKTVNGVDDGSVVEE